MKIMKCHYKTLIMLVVHMTEMYKRYLEVNILSFKVATLPNAYIIYILISYHMMHEK